MIDSAHGTGSCHDRSDATAAADRQSTINRDYTRGLMTDKINELFPGAGILDIYICFLYSLYFCLKFRKNGVMCIIIENNL